MKTWHIVSLVTIVGAALTLMVFLRPRSLSSHQTSPMSPATTVPKVWVSPLPATNWMGAASGEERDAIFEAIVRDSCDTNGRPRHVRHTHTIYFIGLGESHDPSAEFLTRFTDLQCRVRPISSGEVKGTAFYDRASGQVGQPHFFRSILKRSRDEAEVETTLPQYGPLFAGSGLAWRILYRLTRKDDRWLVTGGETKAPD